MHLRRVATLKATLATALLVAVCVQSLRLDSPLTIGRLGITATLLPLLPVPYALLALRHGVRSVIAAGVGFALATFMLSDVAAQPIMVSSVVAMASLLATGGIAVVLWECRIGGRFQRHGLPEVCAAVALLIAVPTVAWTAVGGHAAVAADIRNSAQRAIDRNQRQLHCREVAGSVGVEDISAFDPCGTFAVYEGELGALERHAVTVLVVLLSLSIVPIAATMLLIVRWIGQRRGLPVQRPAPVSSFRAHWSTAYLVALSLVLLMLGFGRVPDNAFTTLGAGGFAVGGTVLVASGFSTMLVGLGARRAVGKSNTGIWVAVVLASLLATPLALAMFTTIGIADLMLDVRGRIRGTIGPHDER